MNLSRTLPIDITVDYQTKDGTAIAGVDYNSVSRTATVKAGETYTTIPVTIKGDTTKESTETSV